MLTAEFSERLEKFVDAIGPTWFRFAALEHMSARQLAETLSYSDPKLKQDIQEVNCLDWFAVLLEDRINTSFCCRPDTIMRAAAGVPMFNFNHGHLQECAVCKQLVEQLRSELPKWREK